MDSYLSGRSFRAKMEATSEITGGCLRNYTEGTLRLSSRICHEHRPRPPPRPCSTRPKRADARRNYEKVLAAAREAFAEGGESTALEEIARRAGVGIGTLYRHFPNRQALLEALYVDEVEEICRSAAELDERRPVGGARRLVRALHRLHRHQAGARRRAAQLPRPGRRAVQGLPRRAVRRRASRCSRAPRRPASCARTSTIGDVIQMVMGIAKIPASDPEQNEHILRIALDGLRYRPG